ncbi:hypothetical protein INQ23_26480, partial [Escherichia coli]|nr:hypothetical protein [Escherichia coli]
MTAKEAFDRLLAFARRWTKRIDDAPEALHAWFGRERAAWRERGWRGVVTPPRLAGVILTLLFLPSAGFWWAT